MNLESIKNIIGDNFIDSISIKLSNINEITIISDKDILFDLCKFLKYTKNYN